MVISRQEKILERLLKKKGINKYQIVYSSGEGKSLPGSRFNWEIESESGFVITKEGKIFQYWFDWDEKQEEYTFSEWKELKKKKDWKFFLDVLRDYPDVPAKLGLSKKQLQERVKSHLTE